MPDKIWEARLNTIQAAVDRICERYPDANAQDVRAFVEKHFNALAADPNLFATVDVLVGKYEDALARQVNPDQRVVERIAKVVYKCLTKKAEHVSVTMPELMTAYQTQTRASLVDLLPELEVVLETLEQREFITVKSRGRGGPLLIFQGVDFDVWVRQMTADEESKASVVNNYHLSGTGNRVNLHSTDNSVNTFTSGDGSSVQNDIAALRREIEAANIPADEKAAAIESVDEVADQFASGKPKKRVVTLLLDALPKLGAIGTMATAVHAWLPK
ncbi:hypothetical protein [Burkholderia gladioli]|uniref:hypothetical protein n=1 Tax=Burkholderia gladioli TaxID=28095 RepID=UPI00163FF25C|nr:hypothetical protein [Burkholderia gladioli]